MTRRLILLAVAVAACLTGGCDFGRHTLERPDVDQVLRVESGDTFFFTLEENATTGYEWDYTCDDNDVEVEIQHLPPTDRKSVGAPGQARVRMHIHRGYDGPSTVTFRYRRSWEKKSAREFTLSLFRRTGDCAFWK